MNVENPAIAWLQCLPVRQTGENKMKQIYN